MEPIIIFIMLCGTVDTVIVKQVDKAPAYTHNITENTLNELNQIVEGKKPVIIKYEDKRGLCV